MKSRSSASASALAPAPDKDGRFTSAASCPRILWKKEGLDKEDEAEEEDWWWS